MSKVTSAKTKGRLSKKELKQDKLVETTMRLERFYRENQKLVLGIAAAIVIIVVGAVVVRKSMESDKLQESYQLTMAKMQFGSGKLSDAKSSFQKIVTSMGGATAAEAQYFLGRIAFEQGNYSQAADIFRTYTQKYTASDEIDCAALSGLAACQEALGSTAEAAKTFDQVADKYPNDPFAPQALWEASRLYTKLGQNDLSVRNLNKITEKFPQAAIVSQAKRQLENLQ
jgi:outer membrane protein assembly factor BamD (BamD/ComL family)